VAQAQNRGGVGILRLGRWRGLAGSTLRAGAD